MSSRIKCLWTSDCFLSFVLKAKGAEDDKRAGKDQQLATVSHQIPDFTLMQKRNCTERKP